jgi:hypothetical protein
MNGVVAHAAGEHWQVLVLEVRRADDGLFDINVIDDVFNLAAALT